jgi:hypothetical protein
VGNEASAAELNADIDGMLMGVYLSSTSTGQSIRTRLNSTPGTPGALKLSTFLKEYYSPWENTGITLSLATGYQGSEQELSVQTRYSRFSELYWSRNSNDITPFRWNIIEQTVRFNHYYAGFQKVKGDSAYGPANVGDSIAAVGIFEIWLSQQISGMTATTQSGNSLDNSLAGTVNSDYIAGGAGNDTIVGNAGNDVLKGDAGNNNISSGAGNDILIGGTSQDLLLGGDGDDILYGGGGNDSLTGGLGQDYFVYDSNAYSGLDQINDFDLTNDKIVLIANNPITPISYILKSVNSNGVRVGTELAMVVPGTTNPQISNFVSVLRTNSILTSSHILNSSNWA